jgi:hypothetical protein
MEEDTHIMSPFKLALALALVCSPAVSDLHLNRNFSDTFAPSISWDIEGQSVWKTILSQSSGYNGSIPPDFVLAHRAVLNRDSLRMRWDDARLELGFTANHPIMPFQFNVNAGTLYKPLGGISVGTYGYQSGLYLYNRGKSKRNALSFQNLFGFMTDSTNDGRGDFCLYNWQAKLPVFVALPNNDLCLMSAKEGFFGAPPIARPVVTGNWKDGSAIRSTLAALVSLGLVTDRTK